MEAIATIRSQYRWGPRAAGANEAPQRLVRHLRLGRLDRPIWSQSGRASCGREETTRRKAPAADRRGSKAQRRCCRWRGRFQMMAKTFGSSCPAARPRLAWIVSGKAGSSMVTET